MRPKPSQCSSKPQCQADHKDVHDDPDVPPIDEPHQWLIPFPTSK